MRILLEDETNEIFEKILKLGNINKYIFILLSVYIYSNRNYNIFYLSFLLLV